MTTTAEKIKVMQAFEDGETIETFAKCESLTWYDCENPGWNWEKYYYRIKPSNPKPLDD